MEIISFDIGCGGRLQLVVLLFLFTFLPREQMKKKMLLQRVRGPTFFFSWCCRYIWHCCVSQTLAQFALKKSTSVNFLKSFHIFPIFCLFILLVHVFFGLYRSGLSFLLWWLSQVLNLLWLGLVLLNQYMCRLWLSSIRRPTILSHRAGFCSYLLLHSLI